MTSYRAAFTSSTLAEVDDIFCSKLQVYQNREASQAFVHCLVLHPMKKEHHYLDH